MHERNVYKTPPDFIDLAKRFDFFKPFLSLNAGGIARINFQDANALRALSRALLLKDFGLDVLIPEGVLVPTIPLRLNYILWIEDLIRHYLQASDENGNQREIRGIDIGTGATAVYALLGSRKNKWSMTGTEINPEAKKTAIDNVSRNKLTDLVTIIQTTPDSVFGSLLEGAEDGHYYFCMCNPPFFGNNEETDSVAKGRFSSEDEPLRPPPSAAKTGQGAELFAEGGELQFVRGIIQESLKYSRKIRIFTTMIGIKRHLRHLISTLRSNRIWNFCTTEFIQGKTTRWGLAWSLHPGVTFVSQFPDLIFTFEVSTLLDFDSLIQSYLEELKPLTLRTVCKKQTSTATTTGLDGEENKQLEFIANENAWSGQRRKRREMERLKKAATKSSGETADCDSGPSAPKQPKIEPEMSSTPNSPCSSTSPSTSMNSSFEEKPVLVHCLMEIERDEKNLKDVKLTMKFRDGILGKDGMYQILQYLKNKYQRDRNDPKSMVYQMSV